MLLYIWRFRGYLSALRLLRSSRQMIGISLIVAAIVKDTPLLSNISLFHFHRLCCSLRKVATISFTFKRYTLQRWRTLLWIISSECLSAISQFWSLIESVHIFGSLINFELIDQFSHLLNFQSKLLKLGLLDVCTPWSLYSNRLKDFDLIILALPFTLSFVSVDLSLKITWDLNQLVTLRPQIHRQPL